VCSPVDPSAGSAGPDGDPAVAPPAAPPAGPAGVPADGPAGRHVDPYAAERDAAPQFVLPLVVRIERAEPPARTDALETAARAVLTLLADPRAHGDGEWAQAVRAWEDGRIRKVVRRARGAEWRRAEALPGITVTGARAQVRVYPPVPVDAWPRELARLQVSGTELDDPSPPGEPEPGLPVLWLNPGLEISAGKAMAQVGHAAQLAWWRLPPARRAEWARGGFRLAARRAAPGRWAELSDGTLPVVRDAGFTEIPAGTCTVAAELRPAPPPAPPPPCAAR
jgi:peptidyl-tRNA hydrolase